MDTAHASLSHIPSTWIERSICQALFQRRTYLNEMHFCRSLFCDGRGRFQSAFFRDRIGNVKARFMYRSGWRTIWHCPASLRVQCCRWSLRPRKSGHIQIPKLCTASNSETDVDAVIAPYFRASWSCFRITDDMQVHMNFFTRRRSVSQGVLAGLRSACRPGKYDGQKHLRPALQQRLFFPGSNHLFMTSCEHNGCDSD